MESKTREQYLKSRTLRNSGSAPSSSDPLLDEFLRAYSKWALVRTRSLGSVLSGVEGAEGDEGGEEESESAGLAFVVFGGVKGAAWSDGG